MKTRTVLSLSAVFAVLAAAVLIWAFSKSVTGAPLIPLTGKVESLPISIDDYTPAQRAQYQITEPLEPLAIPVTGKVESLPTLIDDYTPAQRAQYQITDPLEPLAIPVT